MKFEREGVLISTEPELLDIDFVCRGLNNTYWARDRKREVVEESIRNSLCFGVYEKGSGRQIGFARVVTDKATFAWICDVFIDEAHRGRGLGKWLMACVTEHPSVNGSMSILGTRDAHGLYERYGFTRTELMKRPSGRRMADWPPDQAAPRGAREP
jgi:GNAT superfamily N-acetyltransferase